MNQDHKMIKSKTMTIKNNSKFIEWSKNETTTQIRTDQTLRQNTSFKYGTSNIPDFQTRNETNRNLKIKSC